MRFDGDEVINTGSNNLSKKNGNKSVISNINKYDPDDENNRSLYPEDEVNPNRIKLSFNAERTLSKIPSFSMRPQTDKRSFSDYKPLVLRSIPIFFWLVGLVFIVMAIILTINICIGVKKNNASKGKINMMDRYSTLQKKIADMKIKSKTTAINNMMKKKTSSSNKNRSISKGTVTNKK